MDVARRGKAESQTEDIEQVKAERDVCVRGEEFQWYGNRLLVGNVVGGRRRGRFALQICNVAAVDCFSAYGVVNENGTINN